MSSQLLLVGDWHYGLGCWLECESAEWTAAENPICGPGGSEQVISSLGAWGFYPFWAISAGYYGVLAQSTLQARLGLFVAALVCACLSRCSCCLGDVAQLPIVNAPSSQEGEQADEQEEGEQDEQEDKQAKPGPSSSSSSSSLPSSSSSSDSSRCSIS
eukprot:g59105.t1